MLRYLYWTRLCIVCEAKQQWTREVDGAVVVAVIVLVRRSETDLTAAHVTLKCLETQCDRSLAIAIDTCNHLIDSTCKHLDETKKRLPNG